MHPNELQRLIDKHAALRALCKGGANLTSAVPKEALEKTEDEREFCAVCAANIPRLAALLKIYQLKAWFFENAPPDPPQADKASAAAYLEQCFALVTRKAQESDTQQLHARARDAACNFAAHYSGRLVHPSVGNAFMFAPDRPTTLPHLSSRTLRQAGVEIGFDQRKLDPEGFFSGLAKVLSAQTGEEADLPDLPALGVLPNHLDALIQGAHQGLAEVRAEVPDAVDRRLRQVLLPREQGYLAVSPLPSGGMAEAWRQAEEAIAAAVHAEKSAEKSAKKSAAQDDAPPDESAEPAEPAEPVEAAEPDEGAAPQTPQPARKTAKPKKAGKTGQEGKPDKPDRIPAIFDHLDLPFGGKNPQVVSRFPAAIIQRQMLFSAPTLRADARAAWRFVFRPWRPFLLVSDVKAVAQQVASLEQSDSLAQSASVTAVWVQSKGPLGAVARKCNAQAAEMARTVAGVAFVEESQEVPIDETLLRAKRTEPVGALDLAIVNQSFGAEYRESLSLAVTELLHKRMAAVVPGPNPLDSQRVRQRVAAAIEIALETTA